MKIMVSSKKASFSIGFADKVIDFLLPLKSIISFLFTGISYKTTSSVLVSSGFLSILFGKTKSNVNKLTKIKTKTEKTDINIIFVF